MTLEDRIKETEQKFNTKREERKQHLGQAEECLEEMHKLQGEYRLLQDLQEEHIAEEVAPVDPSTIVVKPEGEEE